MPCRCYCLEVFRRRCSGESTLCRQRYARTLTMLHLMMPTTEDVVTGKTRSLHFGKPQHRPRTWTVRTQTSANGWQHGPYPPALTLAGSRTCCARCPAHFCSDGNDTMSRQAQRSSPFGCALHLYSCRLWRCMYCGAVLRLLTVCWRPHWYLSRFLEPYMMTRRAPYEPSPTALLTSSGRYAAPHNAHRQERVENVKGTACREPLMTRQTRTGSNAPAAYLISVSAVT